VIGYSSTAGDAAVHAFAWTPSAGMVDLGTLGGGFSFPVAVNGAGQVGGSSSPPLGDVHAFSWTPSGGMLDLGTLGGTSSTVGVTDTTRGPDGAINASGQVVGQSRTAGDSEWHAYSWTQSGGMVDLGTLGGTVSGATLVNASGQVAGGSLTAGNAESHAFSWTPSGGWSTWARWAEALRVPSS
jgi:probable HAF family extracellular repeat protein